LPGLPDAARVAPDPQAVAQVLADIRGELKKTVAANVLSPDADDPSGDVTLSKLQPRLSASDATWVVAQLQSTTQLDAQTLAKLRSLLTSALDPSSATILLQHIGNAAPAERFRLVLSMLNTTDPDGTVLAKKLALVLRRDQVAAVLAWLRAQTTDMAS